METMVKAAGGAFNTAKSIQRIATGSFLDESAPPGKLIDFLTTLVTYPALYVFSSLPSAGPMGRVWAAPRDRDSLREAAAEGALPALTGLGKPEAQGAGAGAAPLHDAGMGAVEQEKAGGPTSLAALVALAPEIRGRLADFPEGRALLTLERWCREPVHLTMLDELWSKYVDYLLGMMAWLQWPWTANLSVLLESLPTHSPEATLDQVVAQHMNMAAAAAAEGTNGGGGGGVVEGATGVPKAAGGAGGGGEVSKSADALMVGGGESFQENGGDALALRRLASAASPSLVHIGRQLQTRYRLKRGRTWLEFFQIFLDLVKLWLLLLASAFSWLAVVLRVGANVTGVVSGATAFTVVISVALSVVTTLLYLAASASDGTAAAIGRLANMTDMVLRQGKRARAQAARSGLGDLIGNRELGPATFEELEDFFALQLAQRLKIKSRPDAARLSNDPLLLRAYDLRLVDSSGQVLVESAELAAARFTRAGFFGLASARTCKAGAVLLLRLLAWKRISSVMAVSGEALKYVYVMGSRRAGKAALFNHLVQAPRNYKVPADKVPVEIRAMSRATSTYAVLLPGLDSRDDAIVRRANEVADLSHGVISILVYLVDITEDPHALMAGIMTQHTNQHQQGSSSGSDRHGASGEAQKGSAAGGGDLASGGGGGSEVAAAGAMDKQHQEQQRQQGRGSLPHPQHHQPLGPVWQALALHRPVLLLVNKAGKLASRVQADPRIIEETAAAWQVLVAEGAAQRGLEAELVCVLVSELYDTPPPGVVGPQQLRDLLESTAGNVQRV